MKRTAYFVLSAIVILFLANVPAGARGGQHGRPPGAGQPPAHGPERGRAPEHQTGARSPETSIHSERKTPAQLLEQNTQLSSRLEGLLPEGAHVQDSAAGFKNLGAFVAAVHVSHNIGIPFEQLKARTTGPDAVSLGKAIKELKPGVDAKAEVKKAKKQAKKDLKESGA